MVSILIPAFPCLLLSDIDRGGFEVPLALQLMSMTHSILNQSVIDVSLDEFKYSYSLHFVLWLQKHFKYSSFHIINSTSV